MAAELRWTRRLQRALEQVRERQRDYVPGESHLPVDIAKVEVADALLEAIADQQPVNAWLDRLSRVPRPEAIRILPGRRTRRKKA